MPAFKIAPTPVPVCLGRPYPYPFARALGGNFIVTRSVFRRISLLRVADYWFLYPTQFHPAVEHSDLNLLLWAGDGVHRHAVICFNKGFLLHRASGQIVMICSRIYINSATWLSVSSLDKGNTYNHLSLWHTYADGRHPSFTLAKYKALTRLGFREWGSQARPSHLNARGAEGNGWSSGSNN